MQLLKSFCSIFFFMYFFSVQLHLPWQIILLYFLSQQLRCCWHYCLWLQLNFPHCGIRCISSGAGALPRCQLCSSARFAGAKVRITRYSKQVPIPFLLLLYCRLFCPGNALAIRCSTFLLLLDFFFIPTQSTIYIIHDVLLFLPLHFNRHSKPTTNYWLCLVVMSCGGTCKNVGRIVCSMNELFSLELIK